MSKPLSTIFLLVLATSLLPAQQPAQQTLPATNAAGQPQQGSNPRPAPQQATQPASASTNIAGQPPPPGPALPAQAQQPPRANTAPLQSQEALQTEVALLREKVESAAKKTDWLFAILAVVLGLGTMTSFISWMKHEWVDSKRVESRASEVHSLAVRGETASQSRSQEVHQTFLESSKNTLELVNATLRLAKDASERAAKAVEDRAKSNLLKLDIDSKDLVAKVPAQDDRKLVSDPALRATLKSLAQRIEGFEINRLMLPEEMLLPSECLFVRGMNFHLEQQFDDAFDAWKQVTHRNETPPLLRSLAWYWIGYEQNNLGRFDQASVSFQRALETAVGVRKFELHRILIETRFFEKLPHESLLKSLKALLGSIEKNTDEGIDVVRNRILGTIGNIYLEAGNQLRRTGQDEASKVEYQQAEHHFVQAVDQDKWALFGHAEALFWTGDERAQQIFEDQIRQRAIDEAVNREEPRTKVLAKTTELICCIRVPELRPEVPAIHSQVAEALGRVEGRLTVYSQVQRRNVTKEQFRKDLQELMQEYHSYTQLALATQQAALPVLSTVATAALLTAPRVPAKAGTPAPPAPPVSPAAPATTLTTTVTQPVSEKHG